MHSQNEYKSSKFALGVEFDTFVDLKHACIQAAILDVFEFVPEKVDLERYSVNCKSQGCPWHLHATSVSGSTVWRIRKCIQTYSCHSLNHLSHSNVDEEFISIEILPQLHGDPSYKPKAIQNHFKEQFGIKINYTKAYHAKEHALKHTNGSHEEAYGYLPKYCEEIQCSNPGSTAVLEVTPETNQFKRMFISFAASALGFSYCRPVLGLDGTHLKHKYQGLNTYSLILILGMLLAATAVVT